MKTFAYQARDNKTNKIVRATVKAETETKAGKMLLDQDLIPLKIKEVDENASIFGRNQKVPTKEKVVLTRQLATLINAGLPISQALRTVYEQTTHKRLKAIVGEIVTSVEGGRTLTEAFGNFPEVFDNLFIALLTSGEASGTLDEALRKIADQQEKDADLMRKVRGAMTYPIIVLVVIAGVMAFMMFAVMPQVKGLYTDMKLSLPFITKVLIGFTEFIGSWWWLSLAIIIAIVYYVRRYFKTESGIKFKDSMKLNMPLFKNMLRKLYMSRFLRTGQTLLSTGVPMLDALAICSKAVNNYWVGGSITRAAEKVKGGKALSASLKSEEYILTLVPQMIKIGEQSGKIDEMMGRAADVYEKELDEEVNNLSKVIEPVLMVVLALVAGVMVGAILLPIYGMVGNVNV